MNEDPLVIMIQSLMQMGNKPLAKKVIDIFAKNIFAEQQNQSLANCYFLYGDHVNATKYAENALAVAPNPQRAYVARGNLAQIYFAANRFKDALRYVKINERLMPSRDMALLRLQIESKAELHSEISDTGIWGEQLANNYHEYSVELSLWLAKNLPKNKTIIDMGCGNGSYLKDLKNAGFKKLLGYEGKVPTKKEYDEIIQQDLTEPFKTPSKGVVVCLEVGEHIPAKFEKVFLDNITKASDSTIVLSWAVLGQNGGGHVNCKDNHDVVTTMEKRGFEYDVAMTQDARDNIGATCYWFKNSLMVFHKKKTEKKKKDSVETT